MMHYDKNEKSPVNAAFFSGFPRGFSLVELLVTMAIFGILMTGIFQAYIAQMKNTTREYGIAESDIDRQIGQGIIYRDIFMAGYGLADDYDNINYPAGAKNHAGVDYPAGTTLAPWALQAEDGGANPTDPPDKLTLMGTALGMNSQQSQHWSYVEEVNDIDKRFFTPRQWLNDEGNIDSRENIANLDMVILMEASSKRLLTDSGNWLFKYVDTDNDLTTQDDNSLESGGTALNPVPNGTVLYGLYKYSSSATVATLPYYTVNYHLSTAPGDGCAPGVPNLLRVESRTTEAPTGGGLILPCVADFQVAIGLDTNADREIDLWNNGGVAPPNYDPARLNRSLRQVRVYALVQIGNRDNFYTYPEPTVYVGDLNLGIGREFPLSDELRQYRWRVIRFVATPRNIR